MNNIANPSGCLHVGVSRCHRRGHRRAPWWRRVRHASSLLRWLMPPTVKAGDVMAYAGPMPCGCDVPRVTVVGASSRSVRFEWGDETQEIRGRRSFAWSFKKIR